MPYVITLWMYERLLKQGRLCFFKKDLRFYQIEHLKKTYIGWTEGSIKYQYNQHELLLHNRKSKKNQNHLTNF